MRKVTIPINDEDDVCNTGYIVEYKIDGALDYTAMYPNPIGSPIVIENLADDTLYNIRIKRSCCNATISDWNSFNVDTTL